MIEQDIQVVNPRQLINDLGMAPGNLDLLAGCPPCQGFSSLRTYNGNRAVRDPRNDLIFPVVGFAREFLPKAVMIENVPALIQDERLEKFRTELASLGYDSEAKIFDVRNFGVPQRRRRMVLLCWKGAAIPFASPSKQTSTVADALKSMASMNRLPDPTHDYSVRRSNRVESLIRCVPRDGGSRADLPDDMHLECHRRTDGFRDVYGRMAWDKAAPTITGGCINPSRGRFLHPEEDRAITLREAALLQGFPKQYEFDMSRGRYAVAQVIGNALPPPFAERHARSIAKHLAERNPGP